MTITYHNDLIQGSDEWLEMRRGLITASEVKLILTPTLKVASNDKERSHLYELLAQRISGVVEPSYVSDDMLRGMDEEHHAVALYGSTYAPVTRCGFITNDEWGFTMGCSPDALVSTGGMLECKSRRQKFQIQTICENVDEGTIPDDYSLQVQAELLISGRDWCDFVSYSNGLPMAVIRVYPDPRIQDAIVEAATQFEARLAYKLAKYTTAINANGVRLVPTERRSTQEMF